MTIKFPTTEQWFSAALQECKRYYCEHLDCDDRRVVIGFQTWNDAIAQGHPMGVASTEMLDESPDGRVHIRFVMGSPIPNYNAADKDGPLSVLVHELIHAFGVVNHGMEFQEKMSLLGLCGDPTATVACSSLREWIKSTAWLLGDMPLQFEHGFVQQWDDYSGIRQPLGFEMRLILPETQQDGEPVNPDIILQFAKRIGDVAGGFTEIPAHGCYNFRAEGTLKGQMKCEQVHIIDVAGGNAVELLEIARAYKTAANQETVYVRHKDGFAELV